MKLIVYIPEPVTLTKIDLSKITITNEREEGINDKRVSIQGEFTVFGSDNLLLQNYANQLINFDFYESGVLIGSGTMQKLFKQTPSLNKGTYKLVCTDKYFKFVQNRETEYNICEAPKQNATLYFNKGVFEIETIYYRARVTCSLGWNDSDFQGKGPDDTWGMYHAKGFENQYYAYIFEWVTFARFISYGVYQNNIAIPPQGDWTYVYDKTINDIIVPVFCQRIPEGITVSVFTPPDDIQLVNEYLTTGLVQRFDRFYLFQDVLRFVINKIDNSVLFDDESFSYFNNKQGESVTHNIVGSQPVQTFESSLMFKNLVICPLPDIIPDENGVFPEYQSIVCYLKFSAIEKFFKYLGCVWYIENNVFRLKHYTEIEKNLQSVNVINGFRRAELEYKETAFKFIKNENTGAGLDFVSVPVELIDNDRTETVNVGVNEFHFDIDNIMIQKAAIYDDMSTTEFVVLCTNRFENTTTYYLRNTASCFFNSKKNNAELSFSKIMRDDYAPLPPERIRINGAIIDITASNRRNKTTKAKYQIIRQPIDFSKNIRIFGTDNEIESESHKGDSLIYEITVKS